MADSPRIGDKSFFGFQSGLGFAASADKQFPDISVTPTPMGPIRSIGTVGEEYPTATQHGIIESDIQVTGDVMDFVGICYPLEAFFGTVSPTTVGGTGKKRVYEPGTTLPRFFTNDYGSSVSFQRAIDCFLSDLHFRATLNETIFDGKGKGQMIKESLIDSITLASSPTTIAQKTPDPLKSDLFNATSLAGLDTASAYTRGFIFDLSVGGRWGTIHAMNSSLAGAFDSVIRKKPSAADGMIQLGADADGWAWLTRALNSTSSFVRYSIFGDEIAAGTAEIQTVTMTGTAGTWTLTFPMFGGKTLTALAFNITAAALQALINALPYRGASAVTVTLAAGVYTITFPSILGNVAQVVTDSTGLTGGTATAATTTPGVASINYLIQIDMAVNPKEFPKPAEMEGLDVLDVPLWLMKTPTLNGYRVTIINETATL